jgi:hypothetical protein
LVSEGSPLPDDALTRADSLDRLLAAIDRWVGLRPDLDDLERARRPFRLTHRARFSPEDLPLTWGRQAVYREDEYE